MPEQKMSYEERIDNMAKSISAAATGYAPYKELIGNFYVRGAAKEAVWRQAEAIREALTYSFSSFIYALQPLSADDMKQRINLYLLEHGYIEPKAEEDGKK